MNWCSGLKIIPREIRFLINLEFLHIQRCEDLKIISKKIGELQHLKLLHIEKCFHLKALPNSIANLRTLEVLTLIDCPFLIVNVSNLRAPPALKSLHVEMCPVSGLQEVQVRGRGRHWRVENSDGGRPWKVTPKTSLPIKISDFQSMRGGAGLIMTVRDSDRDNLIYSGDIKVLLDTREELRPHCLNVYLGREDEELRDLPREVFQELQKLTICNGVGDFFSVSGGPSKFPVLRELTIHYCPTTEPFMETLGFLQALQKLKIVHCSNLKALPEIVEQLTALRELEIVLCDHLEALPATVGQLPTLEVLSLRFLPALKQFPGSVLQAKALRKLVLVLMGGSTTRVYGRVTWDLPNLEVLEISVEDSYIRDHGRPMAPGLQNASSASIQHAQLDCTLSEVEFGTDFLNTVSTAHFSSLRCLSVCGSEALMAFESFTQFPELVQLKVEKCDNLVTFPKSWRQLGSLKHLSIVQCLWLEELHVADCPSLEQLHFADCPKLTKLGGHTRDSISLAISFFWPTFWPEILSELLRHVGECVSMEHLKLNKWRSDELPESLGQLLALKHLEINDSPCLRSLPQSVEKLVRLERLTINECEGLKDLPEPLRTLTSLRQASIEPIGLGKLPALEHLELTLTGVGEGAWLQAWDDILSLKLLKHLTVSGCGYQNFSRWTIPESVGKLTSLEYLQIRDCHLLMELSASMGEMLRLRTLVIQRCKWLEKTPHSMGQSLDYLEISDCSKVEQLPIFGGGVKKVVIQRCKALEEWRPSLDHVKKMQELEFTHDDWQFPVGGTFLTTVFKCGDLVRLTEDEQSLRQAATQFQGGRK